MNLPACGMKTTIPRNIPQTLGIGTELAKPIFSKKRTRCCLHKRGKMTLVIVHLPMSRDVTLFTESFMTLIKLFTLLTSNQHVSLSGTFYHLIKLWSALKSASTQVC